MNFQVPQFIEIEDKIVGPLTIKQFLYIAAAGALSFMLFFILTFGLWLIAALILTILALAAAFIKYNGQPLPKVAFLALSFFWRPRLYLWQREVEFREIREVQIQGRPFEISLQMPSVLKLWRDLMTTKIPIPKREKPFKLPDWHKVQKERFLAFRKVTGEKELARKIDYR